MKQINFLLLLIISNGWFVGLKAQTNYYSKSSGNLESTANWGTNTDGSGTAPTDFISNNQTFNVRNNATPTVGSSWTISGTGSTIVVGDGTNACNFNIPSGATVSCMGTISLNGTITVASGGTLSVTGNSTVTGTVTINGTAIINDNPTIVRTGSLTYNSGSTLKYEGTVARTISIASTYEFPNNGSAFIVASGFTVVYNNSGGVVHDANTEINGTVEVNKNSNFGSGKGVVVNTNGVLRMHTFQFTNTSANSFLTVANGGTVETENATGFINAANSGSKSFTGFSTLTLASGSIIKYNASGAQNIDADGALPNSQKYSKLTIAGSGTKSLTGLTTVTHTLDLENSTTLSTGDNLLIPSGARVDQLDGTISGEMQVETALTANRKYRFLCSPVVGGTGLEWRDNAAAAPGTSGRGILITGSGGATNSFDVSSTNNSSAYSFVEANGDGSTTISSSATDNLGWSAWGNGNQSLTNGVGYRVYVRGDRSISLTGGTATANTTTIWVKGTNPSTAGVSTSVSQTTQSSTSKGWNLIGNPYPSNWASQVSGGADNTFYVYGVGSNSYQSLSFGTGIVMPAQAFFVHLQNVGTTTFSFSESQKTASSASGNYFKKSAKNELSFRFQYDSLNYSDAKIGFKETATNVFDPQVDAYGLTNPVVNLNSYDASGLMYNWNYLPEFTNERVVPLTLKNSPEASYTITFSGVSAFESGMKAYLKDYYLNKTTELSEGLIYPITIGSDVNSGGNNRLEVVFKKAANGINERFVSGNFTLFPNPANESINLSLTTSQEGDYQYSIYNQLGEEVMVGTFDFGKQRNLLLNIEALSNGVYFVKLSNDTSTESIKFIK